jgi:hypothetical protein
MTFSEETLMAYVDGELEAAACAELERALAADPELAARVARHRSLRQTLRSAYAPVLDEPVPARLLAAASAAPAAAPRFEAEARSNVVSLRGARVRRARRWTAREWAAIAASLILGAIVSPLAIRSLDAPPLRASGGGLVASGALAGALSHQLASRQAPDAQVRIGMTFLAKSGGYCRTFTLRGSGHLAGIACHNDGRWQVEALAKSAGEPTADGAYRQAASSLPPAILQTVQSQIAGDPLDTRSEAAALARGWRR